MSSNDKQLLILPLFLERRTQLRSLIRELQDMESQLTTAHARGSGTVKASPELTGLANLNKLDITKKSARTELVGLLDAAYASNPTLTFQFAADPPSDLRSKIIEWVRSEINPSVLVDFRLRPTLGGGFVLRTPEHQIDHSWRRYLEQRPTGFADMLRSVVDV